MNFVEFYKQRHALLVKSLFLLNLFIFLLLLLRNSFSDRTLIPNLDPFPDSIHYISPAMNLIAGRGLMLVREGKAIVPNVPPLYSFSLIPFFILKKDVRMFYAANFLLAILSFFIFFKIVKRLSKDNLLILSLTLFLYVTNYYLYWYPTLAMAENLTIFLFLTSFYLLIEKVSLKKGIIFGLLTVSFYATKYASLPLAITFFVLYLIKILRESEIKNKKTNLSIFLMSAFIFWAIFFLFEAFILKKNQLEFLFSSATSLLQGLANLLKAPTSYSKSVENHPSWFSVVFIKKNLPGYINAILGKDTRILWETRPIFPRYIAFPAFFGLFVGFFNKRYRLICGSIASLLLIPLIALSTFYTFDMRYNIYAIPLLLVGICIFLTFIHSKFKNNNLGNRIFLICLIFFSLFYFFTNLIRLKKQIMLNIKYAERPWNYLAIVDSNKYFSKSIKGGKKPILISPLPPHYIDFYSNGNYTLLPLSKDQEFRAVKKKAWGQNNYSDLISLYRSYLDRDYEVYVNPWGIGNEGYMQDSFKNIQDNFKLEKVQDGCYNACNIYKLTRKNNHSEQQN